MYLPCPGDANRALLILKKGIESMESDYCSRSDTTEVYVSRVCKAYYSRTWLHARNLWTHYAAVWLIAGYLFGLGDQHGQNYIDRRYRFMQTLRCY